MKPLPSSLTAKDFPDISLGSALSYDELSNGIYHVRLTSQYGLVVEATGGTELLELVSRCIEDALHIDK
ncbi:hypothetical protein HMJ29_14005 [Hymenobacter taeanensis]|uniref:Uncharacterized protein n=1 Tax=Hymenobacter taeanensis TaxID=2735321 RepID=A0A6M6BIZ2_9BACT|nr:MULTISPECIES: hypothetical protein [Hymenobacter]QJX47992.1 hypothetical protein HMJ29_14005 [Hymenobacter taeanensis]UOQ82560.1 hypothetical protein MUN83_07290 [Hymenobacter sp. 5414T-23]